MRKLAGFTLVELLVVVLLVGVISYVASPALSAIASVQEGAYREQQRLNNQRVVDALVKFATNSSTTGTLPNPYTGGGYTSTVLDPANTALATELINNQISPSEVNDVGFGSRRVRVYQLVTGLTQTVPLFSVSGPVVDVVYEYGVVYVTGCPFADTSCNPRAGFTVPGDSPTLSAANLTTWRPAGEDINPVFVSSLPVQKRLLAITTARIEKLREAFLTYFTTRQLLAPASDTTNWHPASGSSLAGLNPLSAAGQGCRDGWYSLATTNILEQLGMSSAEFGVTAWGGAFEFCRDFDPSGTSGANNPPHYAAIRLLRAVSTGAVPDAGNPALNVILPI